MQIIVMRGIPGSGKTTVATEIASQYSHARVCRDDLRMAIFGKYTDLTREEENRVTVTETQLVRNYLSLGISVVVDAMHLNPVYIRKWEKIAKEFNAEFSILECPIPVERAIDRDARRERVVGADVIQAMAARWLTEDGSLKPYLNM